MSRRGRVVLMAQVLLQEQQSREAGVLDTVVEKLKSWGLFGERQKEYTNNVRWLIDNSSKLKLLVNKYATGNDTFVLPSRNPSDLLSTTSINAVVRSLKTLSQHMSNIGSGEKTFIDDVIGKLEWVYKEGPGLPSGSKRDKMLRDVLGMSFLVPVFEGAIADKKDYRNRVQERKSNVDENSLVFASVDEACVYLATLTGQKVIVKRVGDDAL